MIDFDPTIPWWMSDVGPHRLVTSAEMTPEQRCAAVSGAEIWAEGRLATRDKCNRCGKYYDELNAECHNAKLHERYTEEADDDKPMPIPCCNCGKLTVWG